MTVEIISAQGHGGGGGGGGDVTGPAGAVNNDIAVFNGVTGKIIKDGGQTIAQVIAAAIAGSGNVTGPGSSTDNALTRWDGTTGKLIQNSTAILADNGALTLTPLSDIPTTLVINNSLGSPVLNFGTLTGSSIISAIWVNQAVPTSNNYSVLSDGNSSFFNAPQVIGVNIFQVNNDPSTVVIIGQSKIGINVNPSYGLHILPSAFVTANQTALIKDNTATTGSTGIFFQAGAAQGSNPILSVEGSNSIQALGTVKGVLTTIANAVTGLTPGVLAATTNASIVITDGTGQVYRIPCII
jgi:hypothetical protein